MPYQLQPLNELCNQFEKLPGIGRKTAQRLAFFMLEQPEKFSRDFAQAILNAREKIHFCSCCQAMSTEELCPICSDPNRERSVICVVEDPRNVLAFERTREYRGLYHVLHGCISPLDGVGADRLKVKELMARLSDPMVKEVIMATNLNVEGEATASYLTRLIKPLGIKVTRLAYGIPVGGDLEYADERTLTRALEGRNEL